MTNTYRIVVIPGDGIGNEVMPEAIKVLEVLAGRYDFDFVFEVLVLVGIFLFRQSVFKLTLKL